MRLAPTNIDRSILRCLILRWVSTGVALQGEPIVAIDLQAAFPSNNLLSAYDAKSSTTYSGGGIAVPGTHALPATLK
ncbi:MAG TPA: hypothetical protein VFD75_03825 [Pyrinomonadaceae bacterium]|nr:hypothetical protein [Pyrinomonadaceae bacterium]